MNLQNRNGLTRIENKLMFTKGEGDGGIHLEVSISRYTLVYIKPNIRTLYIKDPVISERTYTHTYICNTLQWKRIWASIHMFVCTYIQLLFPVHSKVIKLCMYISKNIYVTGKLNIYIRFIVIERTDVDAETPILWPPDAKSWLIRKYLIHILTQIYIYFSDFFHYRLLHITYMCVCIYIHCYIYILRYLFLYMHTDVYTAT